VGEPIQDGAIPINPGSNNLEAITVIQENGFTTAIFSRPVKASDQWDKAIPRAKLKIIFAFNPITNNLLYHGPSRSASRSVDFFAECT
jgi:hypothetical protein